jgi:hypothetical protein
MKNPVPYPCDIWYAGPRRAGLDNSCYVITGRWYLLLLLCSHRKTNNNKFGLKTERWKLIKSNFRSPTSDRNIVRRNEVIKWNVVCATECCATACCVVLRAPRLYLCSSVSYFDFSLSASFHHCCTLAFLHHEPSMIIATDTLLK